MPALLALFPGYLLIYHLNFVSGNDVGYATVLQPRLPVMVSLPHFQKCSVQGIRLNLLEASGLSLRDPK